MDRINDMWADNDAVVNITELNDPGQPYSCTQWGNRYNTVHSSEGGGATGYDHDPPLIVSGPNYGMFTMFNTGNASPSNVWIDHTMTVYYKTNNTGYYLANLKIDNMLDSCGALCDANPDIDNDGVSIDEDNCPNDYNPNQGDSDGDGVGDECDDCHNLLGDINDDQVHDILDIVNIVNLILDGGMSSDEFSECEKGDADLDGNGVANILDIIQLINLILDNRIVDANEVGKAHVDFQSIGNDLYVNIDSDKDFSGVQLSAMGEFLNIDLLNNSHIQLSSKVNDGITRMVAYSLLNDSFDGHNATFIVRDAEDLNVADLNVIISDKSGNSVITTQSMNSEVYQSGPHKFELSSIYPNPFNPATEINFSVPSDSYVRLSVYNVQGKEVDVIHEGFQSSGAHSYTWNASDMSSGVYYVRLVSGNKAKTMKAVLMK
ncbi:MAG: T9SS type A sorting domain-containing protein [Candidatus Marinimicrobia bacterium]|nr:T9SS type A sorting domain-containing protein [Candidatus Neomarinimicrobiota bacterium]